MGHHEAAGWVLAITLPCSVPETRNPMAMQSSRRSVAGPDRAMAHLLLLIPEGGSRGVFYNPAHHFTHTFAAQHTTTDTLNQQATQAAFGLDRHPSIPQSRHPPTTSHLRRIFSATPPLRRPPVARPAADPLSFMSGVSVFTVKLGDSPSQTIHS